MASKSKSRVTIIFDGPTEFLHDVEAGIVLARGESGEVTSKVAERLAADPLVDITIEEKAE